MFVFFDCLVVFFGVNLVCCVYEYIVVNGCFVVIVDMVNVSLFVWFVEVV